MANRGLGSLTLDLIAKIGGFTGPLSQAERDLDRRTKAMEKRAYAFGQAIGKALKVGVVAAAAGAVAAVAAIRSTITAMDDMSKAAQRANLPTEDFSRLAHAASLADVPINDLQGSLGKLAKAQGEALKATSQQARVFEALGISVKNADGSLRSTKDVFFDFADQFKDFKGSPEIVAAGMHIFGRSFQTLIPLLKDGSDGLREAGEEADRLGITLSTEAGQQAELFNDNLTRLKVGVQGLVQSVAIELLPKLIELTDKLLEVTKDGSAAKDMARLLATAFDLVAGATSFLYTRLDGVGKVIEGLTTGFTEAKHAAEAFFRLDFATAANIAKNSTSDALIAEGLAQAITGATAGAKIEIPVVPFVPSSATKEYLDELSVIQEAAAIKANRARAEALRKALGDPDPKAKTPKAKSGKSDAEKEAEKVASAIEQMTKAQQDWQNELNQTGNPIADEYASRLREITEQAKGFAEEGVPAEKVKAFTDEMQKLATSLRDSDIAEFQEEFNEASDQMAASMQGPMKQALLDYQIEVAKIDELLKLGIIKIEDYNERLGLLTQQRDAPATGLLDAIHEEIMLLGMSSEQQEIYNNLKMAGVDANSEFGRSIIDSTKALQDQRETMEFWQDTQRDIADGIVAYANRSKTALEAVGDVLDNLYVRALQFLADKAVQALFDSFSGPKQGSASAGSSTGGGWAGFFSSILSAFGGGKAGGGSVGPFSLNPVNERGPELLSVNGNDYLMMGANSGRITPNHQLSGGAGEFNQVNNFILPRRMDNRSQMQVAQATDRAGRSATRRNKG